MRVIHDSAEYLPGTVNILENHKPEGATGRRQIHEIRVPISLKLRAQYLDLIGMADLGDRTAMIQFIQLALDHELLKDGKVHTLVLQRITQDYTLTKPHQTVQGQWANWAGEFEK